MSDKGSLSGQEAKREETVKESSATEVTTGLGKETSERTSGEVEKTGQDAPPAQSSVYSPPPDGGRGWWVVLGAFFTLFVSFGWINCIGVFQTYYQTHLLSSYSPSDIAWISSCEAFMMFLGGPIVGRLLDVYGVRWILPIGSFFHVFGLMMTSLATEYYQILLAQGICSPLGSSMVFFSGLYATGGWFAKKRALAFGIVASGSSLGGVIFPIMIDHLIPEVGFPWAIRISAFLILACLILANLTVKTRFAPSPKPFVFSMYYKPLAEPTFGLFVLSGFIAFWGFLLPFNFIETSALKYGMSTHLADYLIVILNATSIFGRLMAGAAGDKLGRINTLIVVFFVSGIFCLAIWLPAQANAPLLVFAAVYGYSSGAIVSVAPSVTAQISDLRELGARNGVFFFAAAIGVLFGSPVGGQLITHDHGSFTGLQIFSGVMLLAAGVILTASRLTLTGAKLWQIV